MMEFISGVVCMYVCAVVSVLLFCNRRSRSWAKEKIAVGLGLNTSEDGYPFDVTVPLIRSQELSLRGLSREVGRRNWIKCVVYN